MLSYDNVLETIEGRDCGPFSAPSPSPSNDGAYEVPEAPPWFEEVWQRLQELHALQDDWDGYGALRPTPDCLNEAGAILLQKCVTCAPKPHLGPTPDGGVHFEFAYAGRELEFEVKPDLSVEVLRTYEDGSMREKAVPPDLVQFVVYRDIDWLDRGH